MTERGEVTFEYDGRALRTITLPSGLEVLGRTGGYYLIGSLGGPDDPSRNLASTGDDARLSSPSGYQGAPYRITYQRIDGRTLEITVEIGALEQPYDALSIPLDCDRTLFDRYASPASSHVVGAGATWSPRSGGGGRYDAIPLLADIGIGRVGLARVTSAIPWGEITGPHASIRRQVLVPCHREWLFHNHPNTYNSEVSLAGDPSMSPALPAGRSFRHVERLIVTPAGAAPLPGEARATPVEITALYRELLNRAPDPAGMAHYQTMTPAAARAEILLSPEYRRLHPAPVPAPAPSPSGRIHVTMGGLSADVPSGGSLTLPPLTLGG